MTEPFKNPRILIVTPEVSSLPEAMGNTANTPVAKAGGLADVSGALTSALFHQGADVHVALPNYRRIFRQAVPTGHPSVAQDPDALPPVGRIHLAQDRAFFHRSCVYSCDGGKNSELALAFQREVVNNIIPMVRPDLVHCHDWMTGLIPAAARRWGIPCLFTFHNLHTVKCTLSHIEDRGIDGAAFWQNLFFERMPLSYEESRETNPVDLLASAVFAARMVNTVSPTFMEEVIDGRHWFVPRPLQRLLADKWVTGFATGILNAPDPSFHPSLDGAIRRRYGARDHAAAKQENKLQLQKQLGLVKDVRAPLFFWPSRLDRTQKGCQLLAEILGAVAERYREHGLQIVFVADGDFQEHFRFVAGLHHLTGRVAVHPFNEALERQAYAASDFVLMPSFYEPCGLPQMIGQIYGSLPVVRDTGGLHDTVRHLNPQKNTGSGFVFEHADPNGLMWAMEQAMGFYSLPPRTRQAQIARIMREGAVKFHHGVMTRAYVDVYEQMLGCAVTSSDRQQPAENVFPLKAERGPATGRKAASTRSANALPSRSRSSALSSCAAAPHQG